MVWVIDGCTAELNFANIYHCYLVGGICLFSLGCKINLVLSKFLVVNVCFVSLTMLPLHWNFFPQISNIDLNVISLNDALNWYLITTNSHT